MKFSFCLLLLSLPFLFYANGQGAVSKSPKMEHKIALAIHGGAGNLVKLNLTPEQQQQFRNKLKEALDTGYSILKRGGTGLDAVTRVVMILEDSPLFNAGKGSVFTNDEKNEMDAAIMDGSNLKAGAVAGVRTVKNPITAARKVMESSEFVFLSGKGADDFAKNSGLEIVDTSYFFDQYRWDQLMKIKKTGTNKNDTLNTGSIPSDEKYGTVGAVAMDKYGNLAAATSTGGTVNKKYNRIGDSPLIGAGTYANNSTCAVSCTGRGEEFIRLVAGKDISDMIEYKGYSAEKAASVFINTKLKKINGRGGVIVIDKKGRIGIRFSTTGMYRGYVDENGKIVVKIYADE